jgi:hypothetical protein
MSVAGNRSVLVDADVCVSQQVEEIPVTLYTCQVHVYTSANNDALQSRERPLGRAVAIRELLQQGYDSYPAPDGPLTHQSHS